GTISVVVALAGTTPETWSALAGLELPADRHELVITATDPARAPKAVGEFGVRVVRVGPQATLGELRGAAARVAYGEHLAFLADRTVPDRGWIVGALGALRADCRLAAVAARNGAPATNAAPRLVLHGRPGGLVVETRALHWVGGTGTERSVAA